MFEEKTIQGRTIGSADIEQIRSLMQEHPDWGRTRLSREICECRAWQSTSGQLKDMACRTMLLKLEKAGAIVLPPPQRPANNALRNSQAIAAIETFVDYSDVDGDGVVDSFMIHLRNTVGDETITLVDDKFLSIG